MSAFPWTGAREYAGNKDRLAAFETAREQDSQLDHRVADDGNDVCVHLLTSLLFWGSLCSLFPFDGFIIAEILEYYLQKLYK